MRPRVSRRRWVTAPNNSHPMAAPSPPADPLIGRILADRYRIVARIGAGGMGVVYRAWDGAGDRYVVVKIPAERAREPEAFLARFACEMEVLRRIDDPHVVPIIDDGTCEGRPFAVMPYLAGGNLSLRRPRREGAIQPASAALLHRWLPEVAAALDHLHALGFVHRDVTPDTILFDGHGRPMVGDFGLARVSDDLVATDPSLADTRTPFGTTEYADPHVLQGGEPLPAGDQYALAVIVYELLAGRLPLTGDSPTARMIAQVTQEPQRLRVARPDLPRSVGEAVHRGLAKRPDERFSNCSEFAAAVLAEIAAPPTVAQRRLMCPACGMLITGDDHHGGKLGSCPQCKSPLWIAPDLLALVIPADRKPRPIAPAEPPAFSDSRSVSAETREPSPPLAAPSNGRLVAAVPPSLRSRRLMAGGVAIATLIIGLAALLRDRPAQRPAALLEKGTVDRPHAAIPQATILPEPSPAGTAEAPPPPAGQLAELTEVISTNPGETMAEEGSAAVAIAPEGTADSEPRPAESAALVAGVTPPADHPPAPQAAVDPKPVAPPRIGAVAIDPSEAIAIDLDLLFEEWETNVQRITDCAKNFARVKSLYDSDMGDLSRTTEKIDSHERKARELSVLVEQAKRGNDAAGYEALLGQQAFHLQQAQALRPTQVQYQQVVFKNQSILDELNADMAKLYSAISMSLPRWVDTTAPFDRDGQSAATLTEVDQGRKLAELRFDDRKLHLEARVVQLHLTTLTGELPAVDRALDDVIKLIEKVDEFLKQSKVPDDERRRLLHFPRLHVGYAAYRFLATSERVPKKLDDWLRKQDELIQSRSAGFALRGLHEFAGRRFATAAKRFDEFLNERQDHIKVGETNRVLPDGAVLHEGKYTPAIDDRLNAALHGEIAWFFAAAPSPHAKPDKARQLLAQLAGGSPPWQALRAEAELLAREERWEDALAALARAEQRAPLLMAGEIREQREAYENRRLYTLARKR